MRIANVDGRLAVAVGDSGWIDVEKASSGQFSADPQAIYDRWDEFVAWTSAGLSSVDTVTGDLGIPVPAQSFSYASCRGVRMVPTGR